MILKANIQIPNNGKSIDKTNGKSYYSCDFAPHYCSQQQKEISIDLQPVKAIYYYLPVINIQSHNKLLKKKLKYYAKI